MTRRSHRSSKGATLEPPETHQSAAHLFREKLSQGAGSAIAGLFVEYLMFAAAVFLALLLFLTRVPLSLVDRGLGLRLRERFVDLLARISPG